MRRLISIFGIATALGIALLLPARASADEFGCPATFTPTPAEEGVPSGSANRNGDRWVCVRSVGTQGKQIFIDNNLPSTTAFGITDAGSDVLVDTTTGDVVAG